MIELRNGTRIWIAAGVTDMRRGFQGLSAQIQTVLERQPFSGHVFVFRGRRGDMVKLLWFDGSEIQPQFRSCTYRQIRSKTETRWVAQTHTPISHWPQADCL